MQMVSRAFIDDVAFETYWDSYRDALFRINAGRYRELGDVQTKAFAREAYRTARSIGLETVGGICWYLIPCSWLGLHFGSDPRYAEIFRRLCAGPDGASDDARIEQAGAQFASIAEFSVGLQAERTGSALQQFDAQLSWILDPGIRVDAAIGMMVEIWGHTPAIVASFPTQAFWTASVREVAAMGLKGDAALRTHLAIAYWLGTGFLRDPQHAWALAAIRQAQTDYRDPVTALAHAARQRLAQAVRQLAGAA
jgi:hypothetical protein